MSYNRGDIKINTYYYQVNNIDEQGCCKFMLMDINHNVLEKKKFNFKYYYCVYYYHSSLLSYFHIHHTEVHSSFHYIVSVKHIDAKI